MNITIVSESNIPDNVEYPLSDEVLRESFGSILLDDTVDVYNEWFSNTSDVFLARSSFGTVDRIHNWTIRQIAVDKVHVSRVRELLISKGISQILQWLVKSKVLLNKEPSFWVCYSVTVRFKNDEFIFDEQTASRPFPRPVTPWPRRVD